MRAALEVMAEALWQAESIRAASRPRLALWAEQSEDTRRKWRFMAGRAAPAFLRQIDSITLAQIVANAAEAHRAAKPTIGAALAAAVEEAAKDAGDA
jgi:hypothetical protein